ILQVVQDAVARRPSVDVSKRVLQHVQHPPVLKPWCYVWNGDFRPDHFDCDCEPADPDGIEVHLLIRSRRSTGPGASAGPLASGIRSRLPDWLLREDELAAPQ